jgi:hypothetical protein
MTLWRTGTLLHYSRGPDQSILCGATAFAFGPDDTATREDLLCGLCQSILADSTGPDFWLVSGSGPTVDYQSYILSARWAHLRELALEHYGSACLLCGYDNTDDVNVHHRTYERLGKERLADLTVLCRKCHATYHGKAA